MDISFFLRHMHGDLARFEPDRPALSLGDSAPVTYRELGERANAYARKLLELGVEHGDRVGILMYNSVEYWIAYFAITRIGAIAVRLNFRLARDELDYVLNDSGTTVLLADTDLLRPLDTLRARIPVRSYLAFGGGVTERPAWALPWSDLEDNPTSELDRPLPAGDDGAMIMYTSGTTGRPKGVLWSHGITAWWAAMQIIEWKYEAESVMMVTGPLYHIGGLENYMLPTLAMGGHGVMARSKNFDLRRTLEIASAKGVTDLLLFPVMINQFVADDSLHEIDLSRVRRIFTGGDALPPSVCEKLKVRLPRADLIQLYGLTEGTPMATCSAPGMGYARPASVGRAYPFVEVSVRDELGDPVPPGAVGEIWTRSPANSLGYWNQPEETARTFTDGWCHTGDLGVVEDGTLSIAGRKKDMIRSGGENISAAEVEDVLLQHPAVGDAAVVGIPDPTYVEAVCAVVVTNGTPVSAEELIDHCRTRLAGFKKPRKVLFMDELPRTPSQKIQKFKIRELISAGALRTS
ncbi:long-chain fatty acid--CoA ligase [Amycolatopsis acidicola]|uniref:Long-chain fatty acid--CoA ligase n=1 Tax=Amycolatopsis acidicola TaxID=2596893 RepID=A0A5N0VDH9_9PSEU|nr:AMP-binding protein [Amycolatopsis acidicola]KAA9164397.1 long-chain fatty acid--CoA ligase [Amycolatopsis acidicola]